jgi:hypothetical protein
MDVAEPSRLFAALLVAEHFCSNRLPRLREHRSAVQILVGRRHVPARPEGLFWLPAHHSLDGERHDARRMLLGFPLETSSSDRDDLPPGKSLVRPGWWLFSPRVQAKTTTPLRLWSKRPDPSTLLSACRSGDARLARFAPREAVMNDEPRTTHRPAPVRPRPVRMRFAAFSSPLQSRRLASTTVDRASPRTSAPKWCFES